MGFCLSGLPPPLAEQRRLWVTAEDRIRPMAVAQCLSLTEASSRHFKEGRCEKCDNGQWGTCWGTRLHPRGMQPPDPTATALVSPPVS